MTLEFTGIYQQILVILQIKNKEEVLLKQHLSFVFCTL